MGGPIRMTEQLHIQFPSLREVMNAYVLSKVKQFSAKEDKEATFIYTRIYVYVYLHFTCVPVLVICFHF